MPSFPIDEYLQQIEHAAANGRPVIVKAEPGAGKTTRLPEHLLKRSTKKILVVEPRRVAAKLPATFIAENRREKLGQTIGYKVRFEDQTSGSTKLIFMTDGMFVKHLIRPDFLDDFEYIIFDEFHERTLNADLALSLVDRYRRRQNGQNANVSSPTFASSSVAASPNEKSFLKLIIMSATIDLDQLTEFYPNAKVFDVKGRSFTVNTAYLPPLENESIERHVLRAVEKIMSDSEKRETSSDSVLSDYPKNILVFLCGKKDIALVSRFLLDKVGTRFEVITLMSESAKDSLMRINEDSSLPKIICSTNVAETSVTLPGIGFVVDTGTHYKQVFAPWNGLPFIVKKNICQDSAEQRAGRCGRVAAGSCIRLYSEADFISRQRFDHPEIERADLSSFLLDGALSSGFSSLDEFLDQSEFLTRPEDSVVNVSRACLSTIQFIDSNGNLTDNAFLSRSIPLHPRLAALVIAGKKAGLENLSYFLAALIECGGVLKKPQAPKRFYESDFLFQLEVVTALKGINPSPPIFNHQEIDPRRLASFVDLSKRLGFDFKFDDKQFTHENIIKLLLTGFCDRVARVLPKFREKQVSARKKKEVFLGGQYVFSYGNSANLPKSSSVQGYPLLISPLAVELTESGRKQIFLDLVSSLDEDKLLKYAAHMLTKKEVIESNQTSRADFLKKTQTYYGDFLLREDVSELTPDELASSLKQLVLDSFPVNFKDAAYFEQYLNRLEALDRALVQHTLPRFDTDFLELFVDALVEGKTSTDQIYTTKLENYFKEFLSYDDLKLLEDYCPQIIRLENKESVAVNWQSGGVAALSEKIHRFYGVKSNICLGAAKIVPKMVLLAPNSRPCQTTSDLVGFFRSGYEQVVRELTRRYPKHYWPEDPTGAKPVLLKRNA